MQNVDQDRFAERPAASPSGDDLPYTLTLELLIKDRETIRALWEVAEGPPRDDFAIQALRIGILALGQASHRLDADLIHRETSRMLEGLQGRLDEHSRLMQDRLAGALKNYFDPQSGRFSERVERLIRKDGDLEQLLRRQVGNQDSELAKTLLNHIGESSPLMKTLSPSESNGLFAALRESIDLQLKSQRDRILTEFSLDNKEGSLSRLVGEITGKHGKLSEDLRGKIDEVVKEFSLDEENSALSRLVRNMDSAQRTIRSEFSLDNPESAFSRLNTMLEATQGTIQKSLTLDQDDSPLSRLKREMLTILGDHAKQSQLFQEEVKVTLGKIVARREEMERSTRHGALFEEAVCEFIVRESHLAGDMATPTGNETGLIRQCKVGDCVVELGPDCHAEGAKIVIEAKEKAGYTLNSARAEMEKARANRGAQLGLFVFSSKAAPVGVESFFRLGDDVFVVWDAEDPASDIYLRAGLVTARALCLRGGQRDPSPEVDLEAIEKAVLEIEKRSGGLEEVTRAAQTIRNSSDKILERIRLTRQALEKQIETLTEKMDEVRHALDQETRPRSDP